MLDEGGGATASDGAEPLPMLCRDPVAVVLDQALSGHADQIGHFPLRPLIYLSRLFPRESVSKGLVVALR